MPISPESLSPDPDAIPPRQRLWITLLSSSLLALILDLIRRRKLREDDAWLWLIIGLGTTFLGNQVRALRRITGFFGIVVPTSTIFFFGHIFLILLQIQNSVRVSTIQLQIKNLSQDLALQTAISDSSPRKGSAQGPTVGDI